jgi:hypothetical protein
MLTGKFEPDASGSGSEATESDSESEDEDEDEDGEDGEEEYDDDDDESDGEDDASAESDGRDGDEPPVRRLLFPPGQTHGFASDEADRICSALPPDGLPEGPDGDEVVAYNAVQRISVTRDMMSCLMDGAWLKDDVVNVFLSMLEARSPEPRPGKMPNPTSEGSAGSVFVFGAGERPSCRCMTSNFFVRLASQVPDLPGRWAYDYGNVRRWTRKLARRVDGGLFAYDLVVVPVSLGQHWTLAVVDHREKELRYYDSMRGKGPCAEGEECLDYLRRYLVDESNDKHDGVHVEALEGYRAVILGKNEYQQQENSHDCGMFMLKAAECAAAGEEICGAFGQRNMPRYRREIILAIVDGTDPLP